MSAVFNLYNKEATREPKVYHNHEILLFCSEPKYLGVTLDRPLTYRRHLESLRKSWHHVSHPLGGLLPLAGVLEQQRCEQPPLPCSTQQQTTALLFGAVVLIPASLTQPSTTPCKLSLDNCILHQRTTFQSSQASNLLSFVAKEPHCLKHAVPWNLDTCSDQRSPVNRVGMHGVSNRYAQFYPPHNISLVHLKTTEVRCSARISNGTWSCSTTLQDSVLSSPTPTLPDWPFHEQRWLNCLGQAVNINNWLKWWRRWKLQRVFSKKVDHFLYIIKQKHSQLSAWPVA